MESHKEAFNIYAQKLPQTIQSFSMHFADDFTISKNGRTLRLQVIGEKLAANF